MTENENKFGAELNGTHYGLVELKHSADDNELNARELAEKMMEWDSKQWAVFEYCDEDVTLVDDISDLDIDTDEFDINGETILCLTDSEADDRWEEELDHYIDDCILPEIPDWVRNYFDEEKWKDDARFDGRGHCIARYDGNENEIEVDDEWFYIYRMD